MAKPLCVFISLENSVGHILDDTRCRPHFERAGWRLEEWPWTSTSKDWCEPDLLVFRSCYDYWERLPQFQAFLEQLKSVSHKVLNPLDLIDWNMDKRYLFKLGELGIPTIDSFLVTPTTQDDELKAFLTQHDQVQDFVLKPCVGAGGFDMKRLKRADLAQLKVDTDCLLQPFQETISTGEWSVVFFAGEVSHAVKKIAMDGEYRVQDSHGGTTRSVPLDDHPELVKSSQAVAAAMKRLALPEPVYARYDFLLNPQNNGLNLIEVELIEPSLFPLHSPLAAETFTQSLLMNHSCLFRKGETGP